MEVLDTEHKDFFSGIIANPGEVDAIHAPQLKTLVELYPQSGILRAMLARASQVYDQGGFQQKLKSAAVYAPDRGVLYNLINYPERLVKYVNPIPKVVEEEEEISLFENDYSTYHENDQVNTYAEEPVYEEETVNYFHESEEPVQNPEENYYPSTPQEEVEQPEENTGYNYNGTEPEVEPEQAAVDEYAYNTPRAYPAEEVVEQAPADEYAYNIPPAYPAGEVIEQAPVDEYAYNIPLAYPAEEVVEQAPVDEYAYNIPPAYPAEEVVEQAPVDEYAYNTPPAYPAEEVIEQAPVDDHSTLVYREEEIVEQAPVDDHNASVYQEEEIAEQAPAYDDTAAAYPEEEPALPPIPGYHYQEEVVKPSAASEIDDEVYDEITGIEDIYTQTMQPSKPAAPDTFVYEQEPVIQHTEELEAILLAQYGETESNNEVVEEQVETSDSNAEPEPVQEEKEAEKYTFSAGHFRDRMESSSNDEVEFEMVDEPVEHVEERSASVTETVNEFSPAAGDDARVSKYDDDKMPYSFMWWLDKTRKEHADTHQPYVPFKPITQEVSRPAVKDELQQQYFENIFHLTSVEQLDENTRDKRKESEIIDRFIQKDPQMKPPNTEKLDNENKAKKSAEDQNELVSETLARIYLDQMLYPKAISTYQKLLLKFPEKSSYFVAQIKLLEKKIN